MVLHKVPKNISLPPILIPLLVLFANDPILYINTGEPDEPGKLAISITASLLPLKSTEGCEAEFPYEIVDNFF